MPGLPTTLTVIAPTVFKQRPIQSTELAPEELYRVNPGQLTIYPLRKVEAAADGKHVKFTLWGPLGGKDTWYAYSGHIEVREDSDRNGEYQVVTSDLFKDRGPKAHVLGVGDVYLNDPVSDKSPNFKWYELTRNGERLPENPDVGRGMVRIAVAAQEARDKIGKPFKITSGYRPPAINRAVGGARFSRHLKGDALDLYIPGMNKWQMYDFFAPWWPGGLGIYRHNSIVHIDARGHRARWGR